MCVCGRQAGRHFCRLWLWCKLASVSSACASAAAVNPHILSSSSSSSQFGVTFHHHKLAVEQSVFLLFFFLCLWLNLQSTELCVCVWHYTLTRFFFVILKFGIQLMSANGLRLCWLGLAAINRSILWSWDHSQKEVFGWLEKDFYDGAWWQIGVHFFYSFLITIILFLPARRRSDLFVFFVCLPVFPLLPLFAQHIISVV